MFYRFECGTFIEADTFTEAKAKFIKQIQAEMESPRRWSECTCLGISHHHSCAQSPWNSKEPKDRPL